MHVCVCVCVCVRAGVRCGCLYFKGDGASRRRLATEGGGRRQLVLMASHKRPRWLGKLARGSCWPHAGSCAIAFCA
jgi:hypothetical protein